MKVKLSCAVYSDFDLAFEMKNVLCCVRLDKVWNIGFESLINFERDRSAFEVPWVMLFGDQFVEARFLGADFVNI